MASSRDVERKEIVAEAHRLYKRGWNVWPINKQKKCPKKWGGERLHWLELKRLLLDYDYNLAVNWRDSGVTDVECDGPEEEEALQALFGEEGLPPTPSYESSRGRHRLFKTPEGLPDKAVIVVDGIEFRTSNGNAISVVPPSVHKNGTSYQWCKRRSLDDVEFATLPSHVVDRLTTEAGGKPEQGDNQLKPDEKIAEGNRSHTLFALGFHWRTAKNKMPRGVMENVLRAINESQCEPPLEEQRLQQVVDDVMAESKKSLKVRLDDYMHSLKLWQSEVGEPMVSWPKDEHYEHQYLDAMKGNSPLTYWVVHTFRADTQESLGSTAANNFVRDAFAEAQMAGPRRQVFKRVGHHDGRIYIDLTNDQWQYVEVSKDGWRIVDQVPDAIAFVRPQTATPMVTPEKPNATLAELLKPLVNVAKGDLVLYASYLVTALYPWGPFPILRVSGSEDTGKSSLIWVITQLVDPRPKRDALLLEPEDRKDLVATAHNNWLLAYDNMSWMNTKMMTVLCILSTGGAISTKLLYTNAQESRISLQRPVMTGSVKDLGEWPELLRRAVTLKLPKIETKMGTAAYGALLEKQCPQIFGAVLDSLAAGLRNLPDVELGEREGWLVDFARWAIACEKAMGFDAGTFVSAYGRMRTEDREGTLEASPFVVRLREVVNKGGSYEGKGAEWVEKMKTGMSERAKGVPESPRSFTQNVQKYRSSLEADGYGIENWKGTSGNDKGVTFWRITAPEGTVSTKEVKKKKKKTPTAMVKHLNSNKKRGNNG